MIDVNFLHFDFYSCIIHNIMNICLTSFQSATSYDSLVGAFYYKPFDDKVDWSMVAKASPCYMTVCCFFIWSPLSSVCDFICLVYLFAFGVWTVYEG